MCHMPNILSPLRPLYRYERRRDLPEAFNQSRAHLSRIAWQKFSVECDSGSIAKTGVVWQPISDEWAGRFLSILGSSEPASLRRDDYVDGYMATLSDLIISYLNIVNDYRSVTPPLLVALRGFLDEQSAQMTRWLKHPWRVCSVRQFNLRSSTEIGSRHLDGWPLAIRKVFILPGGASTQSGTTWFRLRDGTELLFDHPSPCWVVFENSVVEHAVTPGGGFRPTIELDVTPARKTSTVPYYAGLNGWYPWFPTHSHSWHLSAAAQTWRQGLIGPAPS
jgi:hypothetical protein